MTHLEERIRIYSETRTRILSKVAEILSAPGLGVPVPCDEIQIVDVLFARVAVIDAEITALRHHQQDEQRLKTLRSLPKIPRRRPFVLRSQMGPISNVPSGRIDCSLASYDPPWIWSWDGGESFVPFSDMHYIPTNRSYGHRYDG